MYPPKNRILGVDRFRFSEVLNNATEMENARTFVSARLKSLLKHKPKLDCSVRFMAVVESTHRSGILARTNALGAKFKGQVEPL